uniref:2'-5'-oligoadenylate synthase 2-like n=1 Tax=Pristiophorus japonicus TaxID=55135 RepID=UPI00398F546C
MALYGTEPKRLDDFIKTNLEPDAFNVEVRNAVHRICEFLKNRCFIKRPEIKVIKAVKGGSSGKGTALRNGSDADLVVFLSCFKSFQEQRDTRQEILEEIRQILETCSQSLAFQISDFHIPAIPNITSKSMSFVLKSKKKSSDSVAFDVLPAFDALMGMDNASEAHLELINFVSENGDPNGEFSASFTELQRKFVKRHTSKLKDLIRLLKFWYKQYVKPRKSELEAGERLPAKYAVELLTIYAWEEGNGMERFSTTEGFRTVLELICRYRELCIYWIEYYDVNNKVIADFLTQKLRANRPIILDPADPTGNVASSTGWRVMVDEARKCLSETCVSGVQAWDVQPVKEFEITVIGLEGSLLDLNANIYNKISMIKQEIQQDRNIPPRHQRLKFNKTILNDHKTLLDCGIFFDAKLHLLPMEIFVKNSDGRILTLNVSPTDKVSSLKNKIESLERIRSDQYYLTFQSRPLEDGHTLEYYGIKTHSTININLRLRGGRVIQLLNAEHPARKSEVIHTLNLIKKSYSHLKPQLLLRHCNVKEKSVKQMMDDLYHTAPHHLDTFIFNKLQPDQTFHEQVGETIHKICRFLKEQCSIKIIKTVKGGSSGKGTALKNGSDADLVIFVSHFKSFIDQKNNRGETLKIIRDMLQECQQSFAFEIIMSKPKIITLSPGLPFSPRSLNFHFKSRELYESIEVDVLPAFDALGQLTKYSPSAQVYVDLIKAGGDGGEFSTCFTELQRKFVKRCPPKLKGLIRLVKHWYSVYVRPYKRFMRSGEFLPPKYALELLIIHAWESAEKGENFSTAEGFRTVMELIVEYEELWMFWTDNYNFDCPFVGNFLKDKLREPRPMILDPADPTGNVAGNARWDLVAKEAQNCLQQNCVWNIISWDVEPVKGVQVSVEPHGICLSINPFIPIRNIKQQLEAQASVSVSNHYLEWNGQMLDEDRTLSNYRIFDDVTFDLKEQSSSCILL